MIEFLLWAMVSFSCLGVVVLAILFITVLLAMPKMMDRLQNVEQVLTIKQDRPMPPPNIVPLERM